MYLVCDKELLIFNRTVFSLLCSGELIEVLPKCEYEILL